MVVEQLWGQGVLQVCLWFGGIDVIVIVGLFEGVVYWCGQDCIDWIVVVYFQQLVQIGCGQVGMCGVMDQYEIVGVYVVGQCLQVGQY